MTNGIYLRKTEFAVLVEALRRRTRFFHNPSGGHQITSHWTGLGSATQYKQAFTSGYMTYATDPNPGHMTWWKLTEKGARVIAYWIGQGFNYVRIEKGELPDSTIPEEIL